MQPHSSNVEFGKKITGKIYLKQANMKIYLLVPVCAAIGWLALRSIGDGITIGFVVFVLITVWVFSRRNNGFLFTSDGELVITSYGKFAIADLFPKKSQLREFKYHKIVMVNRGVETNTFVAKFEPRIFRFPGLLIALKGWGDDQKPFFEELTKWLDSTQVVLNEETVEKLKQLTK